MGDSRRAPRGAGQPYVLHLDRVCQLMERGTPMNVELHRVRGLPATWAGELMHAVRMRVLEGGEVQIEPDGRGVSLRLGIWLGDYGSVWRVWAGMPGDVQRIGTKWR